MFIEMLFLTFPLFLVEEENKKRKKNVLKILKENTIRAFFKSIFEI